MKLMDEEELEEEKAWEEFARNELHWEPGKVTKEELEKEIEYACHVHT